MKRLPLVILFAVMSLSACVPGTEPAAEPDIGACRTAMQKQFDEAVAAGESAEEGSRPAACEGVSDADLEKIVSGIVNSELEDAFS